MARKAGSADWVGILAEAFGEKTVLRSKDLEAKGVSREILSRAARAGRIKRIGRGLYSGPDVAATEHHSLVIMATLVPNARISHLSALVFHGLTTQNPHQIWITIPRVARAPASNSLPMRVVRCQSRLLDEGLEWHRIEGSRVPVYSVARTLVDLFRQRNKLGTDIAIEALREAWRDRRFVLKELYRLAVHFRMSRVMKPYLESLLS